MTTSSPPRPWRLWTRHVLAMFALLCALFSFLTTFSILAAGTLQLDGGHLLFSSLAPVHLHGILPNGDITLLDAPRVEPGQPALIRLNGDGTINSTITWQVKLSLFVNAFGFEWPQAPKWNQETGIMRNVNGVLVSRPAARLPADLAIAGRYLGLDKEQYDCLLPDARYPCLNPFLQLWNRESWLMAESRGGSTNHDARQTEFSMTVPSLGFYLILCYMLGVAVSEVLMRWMPKAFRCSCPRILKERRGWCVCWKEDEDGPTLHAGVRGRIRTRNLRKLVLFYLFATVCTLVQAWGFKRFVDAVDGSVGGGMQAKFSMGFVGTALAGAGALVLADLCLVARRKLSDVQEGSIALLDNGMPRKDDEDEGEIEGEREEADTQTTPKGQDADEPLISV